MKLEDHQLLSETGPQTQMGELLRRYWTPALLSRELETDGAPVRVRLLSEDLVAFRDSEGRVGLLREFCAHRGASLYFGKNEDCGLRCWYHGWKYDVDGNCVDMPNQPPGRAFADKIKQRAYPCIERNGVVWTYMGPRETMPRLPDLEWLTVPENHVYVTKRIQECQWTQGLEGDIDPSHLTFLHESVLASREEAGEKSASLLTADRSPRIEVEETPAGLVLGACRPLDNGEDYWRLTQWFVPGFTMIPAFPGDSPILGHSWTAMEKGRTWVFVFWWHPSRPLSAKEIAYAENGNNNTHIQLIPGTFIPQANESNDYAGLNSSPARQPWMRVKEIQDQDLAATESMGPIYDRTRENLGVSDLGIVQTRNRLIALARSLSAGNEPPGRNPADYGLRSLSVRLPSTTTSWFKEAEPLMQARPETYRAFVPEQERS